MTTPWQRVRDRLIAEGAMTEQQVTHTPKPRHCRHCGRAVIAAITDIGFEIAVEPTPTTPRGELHVLMAGGRTFAIIANTMIWRDQYRIAFHDANTETVHAMHQCGIFPPETHPSHTAKKARVEWQEGDPIPF